MNEWLLCDQLREAAPTYRAMSISPKVQELVVLDSCGSECES